MSALADENFCQLYLLYERSGVELPAEYAEQALAMRNPEPVSDTFRAPL